MTLRVTRVMTVSVKGHIGYDCMYRNYYDCLGHTVCDHWCYNHNDHNLVEVTSLFLVGNRDS